MQGKKVNGNTYDISSTQRVTEKFLEVSRCSRTKQPQRNVQKKCAARAKLFLLIRPIVVFHHFLALHAFTAQHYTILYFVCTNSKYYRELCFQPWLNLCIRSGVTRLFTAHFLVRSLHQGQSLCITGGHFGFKSTKGVGIGGYSCVPPPPKQI